MARRNRANSKRAKKLAEEMKIRALICLVERAGGTVEIPAEEHNAPVARQLNSRLNPETDAIELRVL